MSLTFYTVQLDREGFPVKYCSLEQSVRTFRGSRGSFGDPGEACEEFMVWASFQGWEYCFLPPDRFQKKVRALAELRRQKKEEVSFYEGCNDGS